MQIKCATAGAWDFSEQCGALDSFTCTNGAGRPVHVDLALNDVMTRPWTDTGDNPVVSVAYVACPGAVTTMVMASCNKQAGVTCTYTTAA